MEITFNCPRCGGGMLADESYAGSQVHCPHCAETVTLNLPAPTPAPPSPLINASPVQTHSTLAIVSLVCGIVGLLCCPAGIAAVICGHLARKEIRQQQGRLQGDGMALAGLILGYAGMALVLCAIFLKAVLHAKAIADANKQRYVQSIASSTQPSTPPAQTTTQSAEPEPAPEEPAAKPVPQLGQTEDAFIAFYGNSTGEKTPTGSTIKTATFSAQRFDLTIGFSDGKAVYLICRNHDGSALSGPEIRSLLSSHRGQSHWIKMNKHTMAEQTGFASAPGADEQWRMMNGDGNSAASYSQKAAFVIWNASAAMNGDAIIAQNQL